MGRHYIDTLSKAKSILQHRPIKPFLFLEIFTATLIPTHKPCIFMVPINQFSLFAPSLGCAVRPPNHHRNMVGRQTWGLFFIGV